MEFQPIKLELENENNLSALDHIKIQSEDDLSYDESLLGGQLVLLRIWRSR